MLTAFKASLTKKPDTPAEQSDSAQERQRVIDLNYDFVEAAFGRLFMRGRTMSDKSERPTHGCYKCRGYVGMRNGPKIDEDETGPLKRLLYQLGCDPYPGIYVSVYECKICRGLWLRTYDPGCIMNLREDHARQIFPKLQLDLN